MLSHVRRLCAALALLLTTGVLAVGLSAPAATAHEGGGSDDDHAAEDAAAHAAQDLAGESVTDVEAETKARRKALKAQGRQPQVNEAAAAAAVSADPGVSGRWSPVVATPVVAVHQAVLPNGKVLMWDSVGDSATESYPDHSFTRAAVWNPVDDTSKQVDVQGYNIFCAGYAQLPDGNVLVVGGNKNANLDGIRQTHLFNWRTETWSRGPDMDAERWYPSVVALANGDAVIVGGGSSTAEVFEPESSLRPLSGFGSFAERLYSFLVARGDGRVELVGPRTRMATMSVSGSGSLDAATTRDGIDREYGSFATIAPDKTLVTGGGDLTEDGQTRVPTRTAVVVDTSGSTTGVRATSPMAFPRRQHSLTVLADGSALATGGQRSSVDGLVDLVNPVLSAERWDPATGAWTTLASAARIREYHSAATLLRDGRVLTGGGGICGSCVNKGYLEKNLEYFSPPYLFRKDGSGQLAPRPQLSGVPATATYGSTFTATVTRGPIAKVGLVRLGAPTHGVDQGQRYVPLSFQATSDGLTITAPSRATDAPPGYYMLFAVNSAGVPSVARTVRLDSATSVVRKDLARGRITSASSVESEAFAPSLAVDGIQGTRWSSAYSDNQWWQVDLGSRRSVDTVVTSWEAAYARRYAVQTSLDGTNWSTVATVDATAPSTRRVRFTSRGARYVRIQGLQRGTGNGYSLYEVRVFGSGAAPANTAPTASAGPDVTVAARSTTTLDGTGSRDPEGSALTYAWTQRSGTAVTLNGATTARPSFTAPATAGTLVFDLVVKDGSLSSVADSVTVTVSTAAVNVAQGRSATQSSEYGVYAAGRAVDGSTFGDINGNSVTHTDAVGYSWWKVDLGSVVSPERLVVWNRTDCCGSRLANTWVFFSSTPFDTSLTPAQQAAVPGVVSTKITTAPSPSVTIDVPADTQGRYLMLQKGDAGTYLSLAEVQLFDS